MEKLPLTPKLPFSEEEKLRTSVDNGQISVAGASFCYTLSEANGLISRLRVLQDIYSVPGGVLFPDLMLADKYNDYRGHEFRAANEKAAVVSLEASPEIVKLEATGSFYDLHGDSMPVKYHLFYQFFIDGVVIINLQLLATANFSYKWFSMISGQAPADLCRNFCRMDDLALNRDTTNYLAGSVSEGTVFRGEFIPWFWIGNSMTGLELYSWEYDEHAWNAPDPQPEIPAELGSAEDMCTLRKSGNELRWEGFVTRNVPVYMSKGETKAFNFGFGITPPKLFDADRSLHKTKIEGPFQLNAGFEKIPLATLEEIRKSGYELVMGSSSCPSGDWHPVNPNGFRENIEECRRLGLKLIPYVTVTDLNNKTEAYIRNGQKWAVKPMCAHKNKTQLMCHGAEGWRQHWKADISQFMDEYDVSGAYVDMWYAKLACENYAHGCGSRGLRSVNYIWTREMLCHLYNHLRSKDQNNIIWANTNVMPLGMICSMIDTRVVGEMIACLGNDDKFIENDSDSGSEIDQQILFFNSYRLGCSSNIIWHGFSAGWSEERKIAFAVMNNFMPQSWDDSAELTSSDRPLWKAFRKIVPYPHSFHLGIAGDKAAVASEPRLLCNLIVGAKGALVCVVNWNGEPLNCREIRIKKDILSPAYNFAECVFSACNYEILDDDSSWILALNTELSPFSLGAYILLKEL